jgi:hypothetical protein
MTAASAEEALSKAGKSAVKLTKMLVAKGWHRRLSVPERVFSLLPWRHNPTKRRLAWCLKDAREMKVGGRSITIYYRTLHVLY